MFYFKNSRAPLQLISMQRNAFNMTFNLEMQLNTYDFCDVFILKIPEQTSVITTYFFVKKRMECDF